jgi:uncharacterized repeat protein (TIGR01451 family)
MTKKLSTALTILFLIAGFTAAGAHQAPSQNLLLPYFEVDLNGGLTTFFSVVNSSDEPAEIDVTVYTNWGIPILKSRVTLEGDAVSTIALSDWILRGNLPDKSLGKAQLEHCQAALSGQRSPKDDLFYSTETAFNIASGYVKINVLGPGSRRVLFGDYFIVDPTEDFAQGDVLVSIDRAADCEGICERHGLRFLAGGGFDSGTELVIWTPRRHQPSANAFFPEAKKVATSLDAYRESGEHLEERFLGLLPLEVVKVSELGLGAPFGWLDVLTEEGSFIGLRMSAQNRFSVGFQSFCLPLPPGEPPVDPPVDPAQVEISIEKATNGLDADFAPGPVVALGGAVTWTYVVTNTGEAALHDVAVTDDVEGAVACPKSSLQPGESMTCTLEGTVETQGQYRNVGTVTGRGPEDELAEDDDPSHCTTLPPVVTLKPEITIEKATNGHDADAAPGPQLEVGDAVTWTYVVTNTGELPLENVTVQDDMEGAIGCPETVLLPGESMTCTYGGTAHAGQYRNVAVATGDSSEGSVQDDDPSHYNASEPPPSGLQGCTPGYWKNHADSWPATGYSTGQSLASVFAQTAGYPELSPVSLIAALDQGGGSGLEGATRNLMRASVAALLDASHPGVDYPRSAGSVIADANAALASGDRDTILATAAAFDRDNNLGCPLN